MPLDLDNLPMDEVEAAIRETHYLANLDKLRPRPAPAPLFQPPSPAQPQVQVGGDFLALDGSRRATISGRTFECSPAEMNRIVTILTKAYARAMKGELAKVKESILGQSRVAKAITEVADAGAVQHLQEESIREALEDMPDLFEQGLEVTIPDAPPEGNVLGMRQALAEEVKVRNMQRRKEHSAQPGNGARQGVAGQPTVVSPGGIHLLSDNGTIAPPTEQGGAASTG